MNEQMNNKVINLKILALLQLIFIWIVYWILNTRFI